MLTVKDIQDKPAGYLVQEPLRLTVREAQALAMKPGWNNGPDQPSQSLRASDETGTISMYVDWRASDQAEAYRVGDVLEVCCFSGPRGVAGVKVGINKSNYRYLSCRASAIRVVGGGGGQRAAEEPRRQGFHPQPQGHTTSSTRPHQPEAVATKRDTNWAVEILAELTEDLFDDLSQREFPGVSPDALFEAARTGAISIYISLNKGELSEAPRVSREPEQVVTEFGFTNDSVDDDIPF